MGISFGSVLFRLGLAVVFSGYLGMDRGRRNQPAGFRTYLLVCLGAAIAMLLGQYEYYYYAGYPSVDVSRIGAQVINGVGFLGAGTIMVTNQQEIRGLTTAAGLWASACLGLAIGAGNYCCALIGFFLIVVCFRLFVGAEQQFLSNSRDMNLYMELDEMAHVHHVLNIIKERRIQIYEIEIINKKEIVTRRPAVIFALRLEKKQNHEQILAFLSDVEYVLRIEEI